MTAPADQAYSHEGDQGDLPFEIPKTRATTGAQRDACFASMAEFISVIQMWSHQAVLWAEFGRGLMSALGQKQTSG